MAGALHAASHQKLRTQRLGNFPIRDRAVAVGKGGTAGDDLQRAKARQRGDQVLHNTVDKVGVLAFGQVFKRQHRDRGPLSRCGQGGPGRLCDLLALAADFCLADFRVQHLCLGAWFRAKLALQRLNTGLILAQRIRAPPDPGEQLHELAVSGLAGRVHHEPVVQGLNSLATSVLSDEHVHQPVGGLAR